MGSLMPAVALSGAAGVGPGHAPSGWTTPVVLVLLAVVAALRLGGRGAARQQVAGALAVGCLGLTELALWRHGLAVGLGADILLSQLAVVAAVLVARWIRRLPGDRPHRPQGTDRGRPCPAPAAAPEPEPALAAERTRIARELHDTVGHGLTVVSLHARALRTRPDDDRLALVDETAQRTMTELAALLWDLRRHGSAVSRAKSVPLTELTQDVVAEFGRLGLTIRLAVRGPELRPPPVICQLVDRALREALINVIKHGRGTGVVVELSTDGEIWLRATATASTAAEKTGPNFAGGGLGLRGLAEQVAFVGGTLDSGHRGLLFSVTVRIPTGWTPVPLDASA